MLKDLAVYVFLTAAATLSLIPVVRGAAPLAYPVVTVCVPAQFGETCRVVQLPAVTSTGACQALLAQALPTVRAKNPDARIASECVSETDEQGS